MPYIEQKAREEIAIGRGPITVGELNYVITREILNFLGLDLSYTRINAVIGVLECAKSELYRRVVAPYEDKKKEANGDVY